MPQKKILLVDDAGTVLMMEQMLLKDSGYTLVTARNGEEAIQKAVDEKPDLILMDVVMPKMDGFEACRQIRARRETKNVPIILVTTRGEPWNVQDGFDAGCTDYMTKPLNGVDLLAKLRLHLNK